MFEVIMDEVIYNAHIKAGLAAGIEATCGKKQNHKDEESAMKASASLNKSKNKRHEVEPYPCAFCKGWHIGRKMSNEELGI